MRSAIAFYRLSRYLHLRNVPYLPRLLDYAVRVLFACWLPHTAEVGKRVVLGYGGLCIVIHDDAKIGDDVHIGQGVTIGGNATDFGAPSIGNNIYIGAGAKILGPISIGDNCVIGANAVVISNVSSNCVVAGVPARIIREGIDLETLIYHRRELY